MGGKTVKKKIVGIVFLMLLIATALPIIGAGYEIKNIVTSSSTYNIHNLENKGNIYSGQILDIEWNRTYGEPDYDMIYCVHETDDGGFIAAGERYFSGNPIPYLWLLKLDSDGNEEWNVSLPGSVGDADCWAWFVIQTKDGGYIASGFNGSQLTGDGFLLKVDSLGVTEWNKKYNFSDSLGPIYCVQEIDDGYVAVGHTQGATTSDLDGLLIKTDLLGNVQWKKIFSLGSNQDILYSIRATSDGGYVLGGVGYPANNADYWLVKTDPEGIMEWNKTYGGTLNDFSNNRCCLPTDDGGYIMTGCTYSYSGSSSKGDVWLVKTDDTGNMDWNRTFGETNEHDYSWSIDTSHDGGYIFVAAKNYGGVSSPRDSLWLVKTDGDGNIVKSQTFGGPNIDRGYYVNKTSDGGYIIAGRTESFGNGGSDGWIIKLSSFENQRPDKPGKPSGKNKGKVGTDYTYKSSASDSDGDPVYYLWDWDDGNFSEYGPFNSSATCEASYNWTKGGTFEIKVMAMDVNGGESEWSDPLPISIPRNKISTNLLFLRLFERFPKAFPILRQLMGL